MKQAWVIWTIVLVGLFAAGCRTDKPYGVEPQLVWQGPSRQVWAVAPAVNLSGVEQVDPILQADVLYQQLQQVHGLTVIPVNRVAQVLVAMRLEQVQSAQQAEQVCAALGCDALVVATVTAFDPYNPPKMGASLAVFSAAEQSGATVDPQAMSRSAAPSAEMSMPSDGDFVQVVGLFDAANGSVRERLMFFAQGRSDPHGPMAEKEYLVNMDRFAGFVYHELIRDVLNSPRLWRMTAR